MISLYEAGSFLIHLYDKIGGTFVCSQIKLEKMLILAQIKYYLENGDNLIDNMDIVFAEACGFALETSSTYFRSPITISKEYKDEALNSDIKLKLSEYSESNGLLYFSEKSMDDNLKSFLIDIFIQYASYNPKTLGELLDRIKDCDKFQKMKIAQKDVPFEIPLSDFYEMVETSNFNQ